MESIWEKKNGDKIFVRENAKVVRNEKGEIISYEGTVEDITERKKYEEKIRGLNLELERKVNERTKELEEANEVVRKQAEITDLLRDVASVANKAVTSEEAFQTTLDRVAKFIEWPIGHVLFADSDYRNIYPADIWYFKFPKKHNELREAIQGITFKREEILVADIYKSYKPAWTNKIEINKNIKSEVSAKLGLKTIFGFPIIVRHKVEAVMEFLIDKELECDYKMLEIVTRIGIQLGYVLERKKVEKELKESEVKFRQLAENLDNVLWLSTKNKLLYINPAYEKILGDSTDNLYDKPNRFIKLVYKEDKNRIRQAYITAYKNETNFDEEFRIYHSNGDIRWIHARTFTFRVDKGELRVVGIADDITNLKELTTELTIAKVKAETMDRLKEIVTWNLRNLDKVRSTLTMIVVEEVKKH